MTEHRTLYVTDLDGTLLRSDESLSQYTCDTINRLIDEGMCFSYATARSSYTSKKVTEGLNSEFPIICYNGTFIIDSVTDEILMGSYFEGGIPKLASDLFAADIYPIMYAYIDGRERYTIIEEKISRATAEFVGMRDDIRKRCVQTEEELLAGDLFHVTCIDAPEKLEPIYNKYKDIYKCIYQRDIYTHEQWLEIMPAHVSKAYAIKQLMELLGCDRLVTFGDAMNDMDMFKISDISCAVANAAPDLKEAADEIIEANDEDAVARWLEKRISRQVC